MAKLIYVILVNYNGADDTNECINSLYESGYENLRIVIVDNASTTGRVSYNHTISEEKCTILYQKENIGFAGANNVGIKYAMQYNPRYILILNNDTIVTSNWLSNLQTCLHSDERIGAAGAVSNNGANLQGVEFVNSIPFIFKSIKENLYV